MPPPRHNPSRIPPLQLAGGLALVAWLLGGAGCAMPGSDDRALESLTESSVPYPTALPAASDTISTFPTASETTSSAAATPSTPTETEAATEPAPPVEIANQPYKSTPLQLPDNPAKSIPLAAKNDVPAPLPLAPHQRPLNFPLAVAPPQAKPADAASAEATAPTTAATAPEAPAADATTSAAASPAATPPTPPKLVNVPLPAPETMPTPEVTPAPAEPADAPSATAAPPQPSTALTTATYPPAADGPLTLSASVSPILSEQNSASPPVPSVVPVTYEAASAPAATPTSISAGDQPPPASPEQPADPSVPPATLEEQRATLIATLEATIRERRDAKADQAELARLELQLRLLYLLAERPDDAVAAIDALSPPERESCKHLLFGLAALMEDQPPSRAAHRNAKVLRALRDATKELAAGSRLDLRHLTFCEKVEYFGWYTEFPRYEFAPKQQVILYVEVENYAAEAKGPQAFETELQGSYQIFDASGQIVAERKLPLDRETCRNYRRDYFLAYRIYMPDNIPAGSYRLELTLEDLKARGHFQGRKLGQGTIEFAIR